MASAVRPVTQGQTRGGGRPVPGAAIQVVENAITAQNSQLGRELEDELRRLLASHDLGPVEVRFRVCRDEADGMKFICKVESPAPCDLQRDGVQWRWWSPLMVSTDDLREALVQALELRRQRLSAQPIGA
jgi:hypothetical protein